MTADPPRFSAAADGTVFAAMRDTFLRDGFLILEDFASESDCAALMRRAAEISAEADPKASRFSTQTQAHGREDYFLTSGDKIRCFFEESGQAVNKIGHALHDLDPIYSTFSRRPELARLAAGLGMTSPLLLQSMHIFKHARVGGEVTCHQDACFLYSEPPSVVGFWFAIETATRHNGCLFTFPGAHRGPLRSRFRRSSEREARLEVLDTTPWPNSESLALEVPQGALVVLHGLLPHFSGPNLSDRSRQAYALHVIEGAARYPADNWLRRGAALPLRGFT
jgi:phytanoyl-CoA hydroxylase